MEDKQKTQSLRILKKCFCFFFVFLADVRQASVLLSLADDDLMTLKVHKYMYLKTKSQQGANTCSQHFIYGKNSTASTAI